MLKSTFKILTIVYVFKLQNVNSCQIVKTVLILTNQLCQENLNIGHKYFLTNDQCCHFSDETVGKRETMATYDIFVSGLVVNEVSVSVSKSYPFDSFFVLVAGRYSPVDICDDINTGGDIDPEACTQSYIQLSGGGLTNHYKSVSGQEHQGWCEHP